MAQAAKRTENVTLNDYISAFLCYSSDQLTTINIKWKETTLSENVNLLKVEKYHQPAATCL